MKSKFNALMQEEGVNRDEEEYQQPLNSLKSAKMVGTIRKNMSMKCEFNSCTESSV